MFHLSIELQKAEVLHDLCLHTSEAIWFEYWNLKMLKLWKVVLNDFFEAHSGCFSWIVNSLHYLEYSLHMLESSTGYIITVYIDYNVELPFL